MGCKFDSGECSEWVGFQPVLLGMTAYHVVEKLEELSFITWLKHLLPMVVSCCIIHIPDMVISNIAIEHGPVEIVDFSH